MQLFIGAKQDTGTLILTEDESWHCAKVLRKKNGDILSVIDGEGNLFAGKIISDNPKKIVLSIDGEEKKNKTRQYRLQLAIAPTKNIDRIEWFVEKAVEIGIDEISFILCKNSERKVIKIERIQKIVESAVKQSVQFYIPKVSEIQLFSNFVSSCSDFKAKYIAHCQTNNLPFLAKIHNQIQDTIILIGPEGDFNAEEILLAKSNGFQEVSLGNNRLRTETAALYSVNTISILASN